MLETKSETSGSIESSSRRRWLIWIPVAVAVLFSLTAMYLVGFERAEFGDAQDYLNAAGSFLSGAAYPRISFSQPMFRPPMFPITVAAVWLVVPNSIVAIKLLQAFLHGATVFVAYKIAFELFRRQTPAFFGALICAVHPLLIAHTLDIYTEPLYTFLWALAMLFLVKLLKGGGGWLVLSLAAGVVFGIAVLTRPAGLGMAVGIFLVLPFLFWTSPHRNRFAVAAVAMFVGMILTIAPWTYKNYRDTGEFILVNDGFGYNLWVGNIPDAIRMYDMDFASKEESVEFGYRYWGHVPTKIAELNQTVGYDSLTINEKEKVWKNEAFKSLSEDTGTTFQLMTAKFRAFWTPFLPQAHYGRSSIVIVAAYIVGIYLFGIYGAYIVSRTSKGGRFVILLLVTIAVTTAIHVLIIGLMRYRVPNVDPYLAMLSGVAVSKIANRLFPGAAFLQK